MQQTLDREEVLRRGRGLYEQLRAEIEPGNRGKFLIINVENGEYEMDASDLAASARARERFGGAQQLMLRIGHPAAYYLGDHAVRGEG